MKPKILRILTGDQQKDFSSTNQFLPNEKQVPLLFLLELHHSKCCQFVNSLVKTIWERYLREENIWENSFRKFPSFPNSSRLFLLQSNSLNFRIEWQTHHEIWENHLIGRSSKRNDDIPTVKKLRKESRDTTYKVARTLNWRIYRAILNNLFNFKKLITFMLDKKIEVNGDGGAITFGGESNDILLSSLAIWGWKLLFPLIQTHQNQKSWFERHFTEANGNQQLKLLNIFECPFDIVGHAQLTGS